MKSRKFLQIILMLLPLVFLTGCSITFQGLGFGQSVAGGVYKSVNQGKDWQVFAGIKNAKGLKQSFAKSPITILRVDPSDSQTIYAGTKQDGLFYSYDAGASWDKADLFGLINDIRIDAKNKCVIYVAMDERIYKSSDCARRWQKVYVENKTGEFINSLAIDWQNSQTIYAGTNTGSLLQSLDGGLAWTAITRFSAGVVQIEVNKKNSNILYVGIERNGLQKSSDRGKTWQDITEKLKADYKSSNDFYRLVLDQNKDDAIIYASKFGLLRSDDGGKNWSQIKLLTKENNARIYSLALNPKNSQEVFYATNKNFYRSENGGVNWTSQGLPFKALPLGLAVDFDNPKNIYLGAFTDN